MKEKLKDLWSRWCNFQGMHIWLVDLQMIALLVIMSVSAGIISTFFLLPILDELATNQGWFHR